MKQAQESAEKAYRPQWKFDLCKMREGRKYGVEKASDYSVILRKFHLR